MEKKREREFHSFKILKEVEMSLSPHTERCVFHVLSSAQLLVCTNVVSARKWKSLNEHVHGYRFFTSLPENFLQNEKFIKKEISAHERVRVKCLF
jgi:hypothetical protein